MTLYSPQWNPINWPILCWIGHRYPKQWRTYTVTRDGKPFVVRERECRRCGFASTRDVGPVEDEP